MNYYRIKTVETIEKVSVIPAVNATEALFIASEFDEDDYDIIQTKEANITAKQVTEDDKILRNLPELDSEDYDDDLCQAFPECDDCPDYCEVCGSCAKEADFVPGSRRLRTL
ncbi:MAG: hypothetical protein ACOYIO_04000 [Eubacteriales bacterium]